jgi:quercetin dioxygenase-like cupin family protein
LRRSWFSAAVALTAGLCAFTPPAARGNARAETEEARIADILQSTLVKHGGEVNRCFEKALADTLDVSGKIELAVDVGPGGKVTKASPARDEVKSPVLLACLTEAAVTWSMVGVDPGSTVIVPLAFEGQANQFSIKVKDAPDHGPPAPKKKPPGAAGNGPPFSVKLLVDEATMRAQRASLMQLTISPANRIAMHKHPGAEILYVLRGHARILGSAGTPPQKLDEGMAIYIPPNTPHAIENMGRQSNAVLLDVFAPMGPERVYRDPTDAAGRAAFQVVRDAGAGGGGAATPMPLAGDKPITPIALPGGKARVKMMLSPKDTGQPNAYIGVLEADPGAEIARHSHPGSAEILYVVSGTGEVTIGSEKIVFGPNEAIHIPEGQPHAGKITGTEKTVLIQIYAPGGPEERFRTPAAAAGKPAPKGK